MQVFQCVLTWHVLHKWLNVNHLHYPWKEEVWMQVVYICKCLQVLQVVFLLM